MIEHIMTMEYWIRDDGLYLVCSCGELGEQEIGLNLGWAPTVEDINRAADTHVREAGQKDRDAFLQ